MLSFIQVYIVDRALVASGHCPRSCLSMESTTQAPMLALRPSVPTQLFAAHKRKLPFAVFNWAPERRAHSCTGCRIEGNSLGLRGCSAQIPVTPG